MDAHPGDGVRVIIIDTTDSECTCDGCGDWWTGWVGNNVHVVPVDDIHGHTSEYCPCRPVRELCVRDEGRYGFAGWNVVHNSFDGRENHDG